MNRPWLSVILPTYNGQLYLGAALEGVLAQSDGDIEVIAVDDGSTDETVPILRSYAGRIPLQIFEPGRLGNWVAMTNRALSVAQGDYACFLHQDDVWLPNRSSTLRRLVEAHAGATLVVHASWYIDSRGRRLGFFRPAIPPGRVDPPLELVVERLLVQNFIAIPSALFHRETAARLGGMDEQLWYTADWDLWLKMAAAGRTLYTPQALAACRLHPLSQTVLRSQDCGEFRRQLDVVLERHLAAWKARHRGSPCPVEPAARFSIEMNTALAALANRQQPPLLRLAIGGLRLGPAGGWRYFHDSRIAERLVARIRGHLWDRKRGPNLEGR